ncbi:MAG: diadenylate cyclase CdaA [Lachnospiraceae bacterium]|nr:diadenylate cyclase CdaA [Lachnospiraceae bacterium]MBQ1514402.1 diadenylate cyclase CdaA [Lachnospiraceae bacterium]MBQ3400194.1 diadenylate cyclase CdaA [Lachnospiraceae bacterium]MBR0105930.1 diadenylate cyclase CdaA [Lachnospiraceae bacterium]MBR0401915.1 diadenylate cyclase CdaA [Lachnospiraceae bacterium]
MEFLQNIINLLNLPHIGVRDVIEIIVIAIVFYQLILWIQRTRAWRVLRGFLVLLVIYVLVNLFQLNTLTWLLNKILGWGFIALVVILQPELRRILEQLGSRGFFAGIFNLGFSHNEGEFGASVVNEIVQACEQMSAARTGALIVVERANSMSEIERTGIKVDAVVTSALLLNIFEHNTPLHDGAVVVRGDRVAAATCYLPLSDNTEISKNLGTRHRAGLGLSEVTDAWIVIVSEETGRISIAREGALTDRLSSAELRDELMKLVKDPETRGFKWGIRRQKDAG